MKIGRNDKCWCGSGKKYKACHMSFDNRIKDYWNRGYEVPDHSMIKTPEQIEGIREAGKKNTMVLDFITPYVKEGVQENSIVLSKNIQEKSVESQLVLVIRGIQRVFVFLLMMLYVMVFQVITRF